MPVPEAELPSSRPPTAEAEASEPGSSEAPCCQAKVGAGRALQGHSTGHRCAPSLMVPAEELAGDKLGLGGANLRTARSQLQIAKPEGKIQDPLDGQGISSICAARVKIPARQSGARVAPWITRSHLTSRMAICRGPANASESWGRLC